MSATPRPRCRATTQKGTPCRLPARPGSPYCHIHEKLQATALQEQLRARHDSLREDTPPGETRPLSTPEELQDLLQQLLSRLSPEMQDWLLVGLRRLLASEWFDRQTWQGIVYVLRVAAETQIDMLSRRLQGDYEVDEWGYDAEIADAIMPILGFFFHRYWRVEMTGLEHIPNTGRCLLVANRGGGLPLDGMMIAYGIREYHPAHRLVRGLIDDWFSSVPFLSTILTKTGQVTAHPDNARRLLVNDELVLAFPEGARGASRLYRQRYQLARFDGGNFIEAALATGTPIIPVAVVGSEETYPLLANAAPLARLLGLPSFPITLTFPWLGPLGLIPLPSKWTIDFGEAIDTSQHDPRQEPDTALVSQLSDLVRQRVQKQINARLAARQSIFHG